MIQRTHGIGLVEAFVAFSILAGAAAPAAAQSTLADNTCVVATSEGLFLVAGQVTTPVFDTTPFGGVLNGPSVTWIDGTDGFIVTTLKDASGNPGGIWRVTLSPGGTGTVQDLTATLPAGVEARFVDADYATAFDTLFLLDESGLISAWAKPATASLATLQPWGAVPAGDGRSITVHGARQPFAIAVSLDSGPVLRVDKLEAVELYASGGWDDIAAQPISGELILSKQVDSLIGIQGTSSLFISFNVSGICGPLVAQPADVEWDPVAWRAVAIAAEALPDCAFGGITSGENHIVRLPLTAGGGPPSNQPVLLTPPGPSGITGNRADIALVRHGGSEVTYWGFPSGGAGTSEPLFKHAGALATGKTAELSVKNAPPSAAALLVLGLSPSPTTFQGQLIYPAPHALLAAVTSASGLALLDLELPAGATSLLGLEVYAQWVVDDTTTAAGGDIASSQAAVFTVGVK